MIQKRNTYIDLLKGIAALNIINIHTAFLGGAELYPNMVSVINFNA